MFYKPRRDWISFELMLVFEIEALLRRLCRCHNTRLAPGYYLDEMDAHAIHVTTQEHNA